MQALDPVNAIHNLYAAYGFAVDDRSVSAFGDLWTEDAVFQIGDRQLVGRAVIASLMNAPHPSYHFVSNIQVLDVSDDVVKTRAYYSVVGREGALAGITTGFGRFYDTAVRDSEGTWRWSYRTIEYGYRSESYERFFEKNYEAKAPKSTT